MVQTRGKILIVEDQGIVATDIEHCLEDEGYQVTAIVTSLEDALQAASAVLPDLVLMDIRIDGSSDGIEAAIQLRQRFGLPVIYLTAHDDAETLSRAKRTNPTAFLVKPFKPAELTSTVEFALKRNAEARAAREREQSFLSAMDSVGDAVLTFDPQGCLRFMNRAAEGLTGWTQGEALGRRAAEVLQLAGESCRPQEEGLIVFGPAECRRELGLLSRDGAGHWVTLKTTSIAAADEGVIRVIVAQDVTRLKQAEEALRRQADLLDQALEPIFTWDRGGVIRYWNSAAQALYGYSREEAIGSVVSRLLSTVNEAGRQDMEAALEQTGRWRGELTRTTRDGSAIVVECLLVLVEDAGGLRTVLETDRDITDRKAAESEVARLNEALQAKVNELTALNHELDSFNYSVSHDLRAPLRHIDGFARILADESGQPLPQDFQRCLGRIRDSVKRMGRMVDDLLELSRISRREPDKQPTDLGSLVNEALDELHPETSGREIEWRIGALPSVNCDPVLARQVFTNLLANAVKFSRTRRPAVIEVGSNPEGERPVLFVRDNGVGFNMKYADKLFGPFQRLHRREEFEGTGVGLATAERVVRKHGGRIWADAENEKGATFFFTLGPPVTPTHEGAEHTVLTGGI